MDKETLKQLVDKTVEAGKNLKERDYVTCAFSLGQLCMLLTKEIDKFIDEGDEI